MKRILILASICLLVAAGLLLQCGKKGNPVAPPQTPPTPPSIVSVYPAAHAAGLPRNTLIYVTFDRGMDQTATANALTVEGMPGARSWKYNILIFKPDSLFHASDTVRFTISTGARDNGGTALAAAASYTFTCGASADTARPAVFAKSPTDSSMPSNVDDVKASLSEKLAPWSDAAISFKQGSTQIPVNGIIRDDSILHFIPNVLNPITTYTVTIDTNCMDRCGNRMAAAFTWSFTTEADTVPPTVNGTEPANGDTLVSVNAQVKIRFSEPMDTGSVTAALTGNPALHYSTAWSGESGVTLTMTDTLSFHASHQVTVGTGAMDKAGNHLAASFPFSFSTTRGLYIACNAANETYLYQQNDLKPEGYLPFTMAVTQVRMSADGNIAYVLTNNGLHYWQVHNHNNEPFFTNLSSGCYGIAVSPSGLRLAVSDTLRNYVYLINASNGQMLDTISVVGTPKGMTFSANSRYLYILSQFNNRVSVYDLNNINLVPVVIVNPNGGEEMAATPLGDYVFAACGLEVSVIRTSDNTLVYDITGVSNHPFGLAVSPDGQHLAVSCYDEGAVKVYALSNYALVATVSVGTGTRPKGLCYSPDGKYLYAALSGTSQVKRLKRSSSYAVDATLTVGAGPWGIAVTP